MKNLNPNLFIGLGSAVYALIKTDGQLHDEASIKARLVLVEVPNGEIAMHSFQLREHFQTPVEEAYSFALRCFSADRKTLNLQKKLYLIKIIENVAKADNHVSGEENEFIERFRRDLKRI